MAWKEDSPGRVSRVVFLGGGWVFFGVYGGDLGVKLMELYDGHFTAGLGWVWVFLGSECPDFGFC